MTALEPLHRQLVRHRGSGHAIAVGAAAASRLRADGGIAVAFFGDGAVASGSFPESLNLATVWKLRRTRRVEAS